LSAAATLSLNGHLPGPRIPVPLVILAGLRGSMNSGAGGGGLGLPVVNPAGPAVAKVNGQL